MRRRAGIVLALLLVLTGCTPAEPAGPAAEPAAEPVYMYSGLFPLTACRFRFFLRILQHF